VVVFAQKHQTNLLAIVDRKIGAKSGDFLLELFILQMADEI
jgi:hypothetical protein